MALIFLQAGNKIAKHAPDTPAAQPTPKSTPPLSTVADVLSRLEHRGLYKMLRTVVAYIALCQGVPSKRILIESLIDFRPRFRQFLEHRPKTLAPDTIETYCDLLQMIVREARKFGGVPPAPPEEWEQVRLAMAKMRHNCRKLLSSASRRGKPLPSQLSDSDLDACGQELLRSGLCYAYVVWLKNEFRRNLRKLGLCDRFPRLTFVPEKPRCYGIRLQDFPAGLRVAVEELLRISQSPEHLHYRDWSKRIRPATAENLVSIICRLYGFVRNRLKIEVASLRDLVTEKTVRAFIDFSLKERGVKGKSFSKALWHLWAAMVRYLEVQQHQHPDAYEKQDLHWFPLLIKGIPAGYDAEFLKKYPNARAAQQKPRRPQASLSRLWEMLIAIPGKIRARRPEVEKHGGPKALARLVMEGLLMSWLTVLPPWRQLNIRECRLDHNLYLDEIPEDVPLDDPWAEEQRRADPHRKFYQIYFDNDEIKVPLNYEIWFPVPAELVPLLHEYLEKYRPLLVRGDDPRTLFLGPKGQPLARHDLTNLVKGLTERYAGRAVAPHRFRNIYTAWLLRSGAPDPDHNILAKSLWHKGPGQALLNYGDGFGASAALAQVQQLRCNQRQHELQPQRTAENSSTPAAANNASGAPRPADEPEFGRCRRCGNAGYLSSRGYCSPQCERGLPSGTKRRLVEAHRAA